MQVNMHEAKSQLSQLGRLVWEGKEVVIARSGVPYLRLEPYRQPVADRTPGGMKEEIWMAPDFDEYDERLAKQFQESTVFPDEVK